MPDLREVGKVYMIMIHEPNKTPYCDLSFQNRDDAQRYKDELNNYYNKEKKNIFADFVSEEIFAYQ